MDWISETKKPTHIWNPVNIIGNMHRHYISFQKNPYGSTVIFKCLPDFDLHLLILRMDKPNKDKTSYDSISIKMHSCTFRCINVNITQE